MFVATIAGYQRLAGQLGHPDRFGLTLDIGHCRVLEPEPAAQCVRRTAGALVHVQIDDARRGVHEHLPLGTGEVEFRSVLAGLAEVGYSGLVSVELPRHSHAAPALARQSLQFLREAAAAGSAPLVPGR
jgi:sugar phosphate isomerase/epimerase